MECEAAIVGGGVVGASLARALEACGRSVALIERAPPPALREAWDARIYTLSPASVAFLSSIGVWSRLDPARITPIYAMRVFGDAPGALLEFDALDCGLSELAVTVESARLQQALWQSLQGSRRATLLCPAAPRELVRGERAIEVVLESGEDVRAKLAVGADGARSWLRQAAGIGVASRAYEQLGVVANFACARAHRNTAWQWFREDGVLAYLPLAGERISIVWSTPENHARALLALAPEALAARVAEAGRHVLGELSLVTPPAAFPLLRQSARRRIAPRIALVGDAAHVVHPLAGQGANLGLGDARALAARIARHPHADPGEPLVLRGYERERAEDILALDWLTEGLFRLFGARRPLVARLRNWGLNLTDSAPAIKTLLARRATRIGGGAL